MVTATLILFVPGITAHEAKESAWVIPFTIPTFVGYVVLWTAWKLGNRFPNLALPGYSEIILGKIIGKVIGAAYVLFLFLINFLVIREFVDFLTLTILPRTPAIVLIIVTVFLGSYGAKKGLEVIARSAQFILPLFVLSFVIGLIFCIPELDLGKLLPVFEDGILPVVRGSVAPAAWYGEVAILLIIIPMANKPKEIKRKGVIALLGISVFLTVDTIFTIATFGAELTSRFTFPFWTLLKAAEYRDFVERIESFAVVIWVTGVVIKTSLLDYLTARTAAEVLGLKDYKVMLYASALLLIPAAAFLFDNIIQLKQFLGEYWPPIGLTFELVIPICLLIIAVIRKKATGVGK